MPMSQPTPPVPTPRTERLEPGSLREQRQNLADTCEELLRAGDEATLRLVLHSHHAADLADLMRRLGEENGHRILALLGPGLAAQTLAAADTATALPAASGLDEGTLSAVVSQMAPDAAADLLAELPSDLCGRLLEQMEAEQAAEIEELLAHAGESGGGIMTSRLIAVRDSITVSDAVHYLREWAGDEEILSLFVVVDDGRLTGTLSLRRMLLAEPETVIEDLVEPDPISVQVDVDQEEIARIFAEYDLLAVPVVGRGRRVGGAGHRRRYRRRDPRRGDRGHLRDGGDELGRDRRALDPRGHGAAAALASALPRGDPGMRSGDRSLRGSVVPPRRADPLRAGDHGDGGNSGIQTSTVTVRSLATEDFPQRNLLHVVRRKLRTALGMGLFLGLLVGGVAGVWAETGIVAACVGAAMAAAIVLSALLGAVVPLLFRALGIDPAVSSGPLITTLNDVLSLGIYFAIAAAVLRVWN